VECLSIAIAERVHGTVLCNAEYQIGRLRLMRHGIQALILALTLGCVGAIVSAVARADNSAKGPDTITVTANRQHQVADEQLAQDVKAALRSDPIVDDNHVTIIVKNGVVTMQGFVLDAWDLLALRRVAKKVPGVKKIVNDVELVLNDQ
jgi:osmotically-inducible protein OsmY